MPLERETCVALEADLNRVGGVARAETLALLNQPLVFQEIGLADIEIEIDRIGGYDGGQKRAAAGASCYVIAFADELPADPPGIGAWIWVNSTSNSADRTLASADRTLASAVLHGLVSLIEPLLRDRGVRHERPSALKVSLGELKLHLRALESRAVAIEDALERTGVDHEKKVPLFDDGAIGEFHLIQHAGDASADLDRVDGIEPARIFVPFDDRFFDRVRHRNGGRWRRAGRFRLLFAARRQRQHRQRDESGEQARFHSGRHGMPLD